MIYALLDKKDSAFFEERKSWFEQHFELNPPGREKITWLDDLSKWTKLGKAGDTLIATDIFCLGKNSIEILRVLSQLLSQKKRVIIIKQQYDFRNIAQNRSLSKAFLLASQITQDAHKYFPHDSNQATKKKVGRPVGSKSVNKTLASHHEEIETALSYGAKITTLAKRYGVTRNTIRKYINENVSENLKPKNTSPKKR